LHWLRKLETGRSVTVTEFAAEKINSSYVARILRLTLLPSGVVEAILDGRQPQGMTLPGIMGGAATERGGSAEDIDCQCEDLGVANAH
jgi:hypothetical protein